MTVFYDRLIQPTPEPSKKEIEYHKLVDTCSQNIVQMLDTGQLPTAYEILNLINQCIAQLELGKKRPIRQLSFIISKYLKQCYRLPPGFRSRPSEIKWLLRNSKTRVYFVQLFKNEIGINQLHYLFMSEESREKDGYEGLYQKM